LISCLFCSRHTRPSGSRRSWRRRWGRTGLSLTGSVWELITPSGTKSFCTFFSSFIYLLMLSPFFFSFKRLKIFVFSLLLLLWRYNAKRRHWRRTKLGFWAGINDLKFEQFKFYVVFNFVRLEYPEELFCCDFEGIAVHFWAWFYIWRNGLDQFKLNVMTSYLFCVVCLLSLFMW